MPKTKNNHYIPQFYISQWKFTDMQVYCLKKENSNIFETSPRNIFADRIWDNEVETMFTQIENKIWLPIINKILKYKTMDKLSETELECFLSFAIALKVRKKHIVAKVYEKAESNNAKFDNELIRDGKATKEQIEKLQKYNKPMFNLSFLSVFNPEGSILNPFKRFTFGAKIIEEKDMQYGQFLTSNHPLLMLPNVYTPSIVRQLLTSNHTVFYENASLWNVIVRQFLTSNHPLLMLGEKGKVHLIMIALTPKLLIFGARGPEIFKTVHNTPIDIIIKEFNQEIYNDPESEYVISNKKSLLEQLRRAKKYTFLNKSI